MRLFIDGVERVTLNFGSNLVFGSTYTFGTLTSYLVPNTLTANIPLTDSFSKLYIGGNAFGGNLASCRIDNFKMSRIHKEPIVVNGQEFDNDYTSNTSVALPVVEDVYTTYLNNFNTSTTKIEDFAILKNRATGIFDFNMDVIDSFDIINSNARVEEITTALINQLKPAVSRAFIKYVK